MLMSMRSCGLGCVWCQMPIVDAVLLRDRAQPDWITATVREGMGTVPEVVRAVRDAVQAQTWESDWHAGHGRWARQFTVCGLGDEVYLTVMQGLEGYPDIVGYQATSERAPYLFGALRGLPDHVMYRLTRLDVRWDFEGGSSVRVAAVEAMRCIADQHGVTLGTHETRRRGKSLGVTDYAGAPSSPTRIRVYDKHAESGNDLYRGVTRLEVQQRWPSPHNWVRVQDLGSPADVVRGSPWARQVILEVVGDRVDRVPAPLRDLTPLDRCIEHLALQYGSSICDWVDGHVGGSDAGWQAFVRRMEAGRSAQRERRSARQARWRQAV